MLLFLLPLFALALIMLPFFVMLKRRKEGKPLKTRKAILINAGSFIGVMVMMSVFVPLLRLHRLKVPQKPHRQRSA